MNAEGKRVKPGQGMRHQVVLHRGAGETLIDAIRRHLETFPWHASHRFEMVVVPLGGTLEKGVGCGHSSSSIEGRESDRA